MTRYLLILGWITTSWLHSQPVYNLLLPSDTYHQTIHCLVTFDGYSLVVGERLELYGDYNSQIFTLRISDTGEILDEQIVYEADSTRYGIESTGYNGVQIGDTLYINLNREYGLFTHINHAQLFVLDTLGQLLHTKENILSAANEGVLGINKTNDNGLVMVGIRHYSGTDGALLMMVTDTLGTVQWEREIRYMGEYRAEGFCVAQMPNGDFIISGDTYVGNPPDGDWQMYYARTDSMGNVLWEHDLGAEGVWDSPAWFELKEDGGFNLFGGYNQEPYFAKVDANGEIYYEKFYTMEGFSMNRFPMKYNDNYIFMIIQVEAVVKNHVWVVDSNFNTISNHQIGWEANTSNQVQDIKLSTDCALVMCGYRNGNAGQSGLLLKTTLEGFNCGYPDCYDEYINEYGDCVGTGTSIDNPPSLANEVNISISPNPGNGLYSIQIMRNRSNSYNSFLLCVYDLLGRETKCQSLGSQEEILLDLSDLPSGRYIVKVKSDEYNYEGALIHIR